MITDMKQNGVPNRTPFTMAQGGTGETGRPRVQMTKPVQTGNTGLTRPVMSNQDAAASRVGQVPQASMTNPLIQNLPLSAAKPMGQNDSQAQPFQLPMNPNAGMPISNPELAATRVSSAKGGPTPASHVPTGNWWEPTSKEQWYDYTHQSQQQASEEPPSFLGPWAIDNAPFGQQNAQAQSPAEVVRNGLSQLKNSEIMKILVDISNGRIRGLADE